jgi:hypothetical protein
MENFRVYLFIKVVGEIVRDYDCNRHRVEYREIPIKIDCWGINWWKRLINKFFNGNFQKFQLYSQIHHRKHITQHKFTSKYQMPNAKRSLEAINRWSKRKAVERKKKKCNQSFFIIILSYTWGSTRMHSSYIMDVCYISTSSIFHNMIQASERERKKKTFTTMWYFSISAGQRIFSRIFFRPRLEGLFVSVMWKKSFCASSCQSSWFGGGWAWFWDCLVGI